jgi:hypothetical protein
VKFELRIQILRYLHSDKPFPPGAVYHVRYEDEAAMNDDSGKQGGSAKHIKCPKNKNQQELITSGDLCCA